MTFFIGESYRNDVTCYEIPAVHSTALNLLLLSASVHFVEEKKPKGCNMNQVASGSVHWGISKLCSLLETH